MDREMNGKVLQGVFFFVWRMTPNNYSETILRQLRLSVFPQLEPPSGTFTSDVLLTLLALGQTFAVRPPEN
jgi:hypothetical protein